MVAMFCSISMAKSAVRHVVNDDNAQVWVKNGGEIDLKFLHAGVLRS